MNAVQPSKSEVAAKFAAGFHCAHCSLAPWAQALGYDAEELYAMSSSFGGGMFLGHTCGAVTGSLLAIGLACGGSDPEAIAHAREKALAFQQAFAARFGSTCCKELVGYDFSIPGEHEKAAESGKLLTLCPSFVCGAVELMKELMKDE